MSALLDKIRKAREIRVPVRDGVALIARRPTDLEMGERRGRISPRESLQFVTGWEGVTEQVIAGRGEPHPEPFDPDLLAEWLADDLDTLLALSAKVHEAYAEHLAAVSAAKKKSPST